MLLDAGAELYGSHIYGTLLHVAAEENAIDCLTLLLGRGLPVPRTRRPSIGMGSRMGSISMSGVNSVG